MPQAGVGTHALWCGRTNGVVAVPSTLNTPVYHTNLYVHLYFGFDI